MRKTPSSGAEVQQKERKKERLSRIGSGFGFGFGFNSYRKKSAIPNFEGKSYQNMELKRSNLVMSCVEKRVEHRISIPDDMHLVVQFDLNLHLTP
ncbi:hypothetical protein SDJN03_11087, partial [Cucurbita argyrosperma subsp. sororia]